MSIWTVERLSRLKAYCEEGLSARNIAARFGDVSKSAIVGVCNRHGFDLLATAERWEQEKVEQLIALRETGSSIAEIAAIVGTSYSAVSRKLRRLGLTRPRDRRTRDNISAQLRPKLSKVPLPGSALADELDAETPPPSFLGIPFMELEDHHCRYPRGDNPILFCGQPKMADSSYCPECHARCWTPRVANKSTWIEFKRRAA
jgi:hypothetical protein